MNRTIRALLLLVAAAQGVGAIVLAFDVPAATALLPLEGATPMSYILWRRSWRPPPCRPGGPCWPIAPAP